MSVFNFNACACERVPRVALDGGSSKLKDCCAPWTSNGNAIDEPGYSVRVHPGSFERVGRDAHATFLHLLDLSCLCVHVCGLRSRHFFSKLDQILMLRYT